MRTCETCMYVVKHRPGAFLKPAFYCSITKCKNSSIGLKRIETIKKADNCAWYFNEKHRERYGKRN